MITIAKNITTLPEHNSLLLSLECTSAPSGWQNAVFVFQANAGEVDGDGTNLDRFVAIASLNQIDDLALLSAPGRPYYRATKVELVCRSDFELAAVWSAIAEDLQELTDNHRAREASPIGATEIIFS